MVQMVEAELLSAIEAAPDDDAPRLVYADHLMQAGDLRGEAIALQCRLAATEAAEAPIDPDVIVRERQLRETFEHRWLQPLRDIVDAGFVMRRGFVEHVAFWRARDCVEHLGGIRAAAPLVRSIACHASVIQQPIGAAWSGLSTVALHEPADAQLDDIAGFVGSSQLRALRRLQLTNARIESGQVHAWLAFSQPLEHLGFHCGQAIIERPDGTLVGDAIASNRALHGLRSLHLGGFALRDARPLACLSALERLALHRCAVTADNVRSLLATLPHLAVLELDDDDRQLGQVDVRELLAATPRLQRLALRNCKLGADGLRELLASPVIATLRRLELEDCGLDDTAAAILLAALPRLSQLTWIRIVDERLPPDLSTEIDAHQRLRYEPAPPHYPAEIVDPLPANKIMAIKEYRARVGTGLADAKMAVERIAEELYASPAWGNYRSVPRWARP